MNRLTSSLLRASVRAAQPLDLRPGGSQSRNIHRVVDPDVARHAMRVLCPIHSPDPAPPTSEPVVSEAAEPRGPELQNRRGCQGNQVFDTAFAKDLAGCAFAAYHHLNGDPAVSLRSVPSRTCLYA